jgi:predicted Ser/Thr protein kinase
MVNKKESKMTVFEQYGRQAIGRLMAQDGIVFDSTDWTKEKENKLINRMFEYMLANGYTKRQANNVLNRDEDFIPDNLAMLPRV